LRIDGRSETILGKRDCVSSDRKIRDTEGTVGLAFGSHFEIRGERANPDGGSLNNGALRTQRKKGDRGAS